LINQRTQAVSCDGEGYVIQPRSLVLGWTQEKIKLPNSSRIGARVEGKSSLARVGVGDGTLLNDTQLMVRKGGVVVCASAAPVEQTEVSLDLFTFAMSEKRLQGTLYGSCNPRNDVPKLLDLYMRDQLKLDELITTTYPLEEINQGYADMHAGKNLRGLIVFDR